MAMGVEGRIQDAEGAEGAEGADSLTFDTRESWQSSRYASSVSLDA